MARNFLFPLLAVTALLFLSGCSKSIREDRVNPPTKGAMVSDKDKIAMADSLQRQPSVLIIIDPGHGGKDEGTKSLDTPVHLEKNLTLTTAQILNTYLQGFGYKTIMTRRDDLFIPLKERADFANQKNAKLFVSVHYNAAENSKAHGIEVYYYQTADNKERSEKSKALASTVLEHVINNTKAKSRGVKHGNFAVIRETKMPAILVEGGFMTNPEEMQKIKDAAYIKKLAWAIASGIKQYLQVNK